jgi:hypothetical protein
MPPNSNNTKYPLICFHLITLINIKSPKTSITLQLGIANKSYFESQLLPNSNNPRKTWNLLKEAANITNKSSNIKRQRTCDSRILSGPALETDWNFDWRHTRLWTTAQRDFSYPLVVCNSSKTGRNGGGHAVTRFLMKYFKIDTKMFFLMSCLKLKKNWRTCLQEYVGIFLSSTLGFCREFDIKVDIARYN